MNSTDMPRKLNIAPAKLPTKTCNASVAFPKSFLSGCASLLNQFFKALLCFSGVNPESAGPPLPTKTPVITIAIVKMATERAVGIGTL